MLDAVKRNVALILGILLAAGGCVLVAPFLVNSRGAIGPLILQAESVPAALAAVIAAMAFATVVACLVGRYINTAVGLFVLGTGLYALGGRMATVEELIWGGSLRLLPFEGLLWAALVLASVLAVFRVAGPLTDVHPPDARRPPHWLRSRDAIVSVAAGAAIVIGVWMFAQSTMRGQVIGAVFVGSMVAGVGGRLLAPNVQPVLLFAVPCLFGAIGHVIGLFMLRGTPEAAFVEGTLPTLLRPLPIDFAAAGLMGISVGLGWARSFLHHEDEPAVGTMVGRA